MAATTLRFVVFAVSCALLAASVSSLPAAVLSVGDEKGWMVPSNGTESYNHWAKRNRFHVGDVLEFKYASNDSVLVVNHDDYKQCSTDAPLSRFTDGDTKFTFDRFGLFYFLSGAPGHCEAGQRMIARVMAPSSLTGAPAAAPVMPPASNVGVPTPSSPVVAVPSSGSSSGAVTSSTLSPSPTEQASGASITVVSSVVLGLVVMAFVSLFVMV